MKLPALGQAKRAVWIKRGTFEASCVEHPGREGRDRGQKPAQAEVCPNPPPRRLLATTELGQGMGRMRKAGDQRGCPAARIEGRRYEKTLARGCQEEHWEKRGKHEPGATR